MSSIESTNAGGVGTLTLDDPDRRNAISLDMAHEISAALDGFEADETVSAVVVTGAGRAFCAGADLAVLESGDAASYRRLYEAFLRVARCPLPTIAAVNGAAIGAGMNLALSCDVRIAARSARFIARFLEIGLHPGGSHTWMLTRAIGLERAKAMLMLGEELDGQAAADWGLALRCVEDERVVDEAVELGRYAARLPRPVVERVKRTLERMPSIPDQESAVEIETEAQMWSAEQPFFRERIASLKAKISSKGD